MSTVLNFVFCIMFAGFASAAAGIRHVRSTGSLGGSSSFSSSSSSSSGSGSGSLGGTGSIGGTGGAGYGNVGGAAPHSGFNPGVVNRGAAVPGPYFPGNFMFPTVPSFGFPNSAFPIPNFMNQYQQWLAHFTAAQQQAAQQQAALHQAHMANLLAQQKALMEQQQALAAQQQTSSHGSTQYPSVDSNTVLPDARMGSAYSGSGSSGSGTPGTSDFVFTGASIGIGPEGGHGEAASFPGGPDGLGVRISEDYDPPSQPGTQGVFTSSSSGISTINGKTTSFKTSTFGKNDNGKITFRTINE